MTTVRTKLKKVFLVGASLLCFLAAFIFDVINWSVTIDADWLKIIRDLVVLMGFVLLYFFVESMWKRGQSPVKKLGFALVLTLVVGAGIGLLSFVASADFDAKNYALYPLQFASIVLANIYGVVLGTTALIVLLLLRDIILAKRKKGTLRNFLIFVGLTLATAISTLGTKPLETGLVTYLLFGCAVASMLMNSFRLSWIVYLTKREKLFSMTYGFLLFCCCLTFDILTTSGMPVGKALLFYSPELKSAIMTAGLFATIYFGMTFVSTLFHLPTAEAFDRKTSEISSLHNLSRLVTQVLDFNELVDSVTKMTLEVCEAKSAWLEIINTSSSTNTSRGLIQVHKPKDTAETVSLKNISLEETEIIVSGNGSSIRNLVLQSRKPMVIDDVGVDKNTRHLVSIKNKFSSLVVVPLLSHETIIGILYATKEMSYGFDKDDVDVISAFADQATIAIENSRLIEKSLERERLMREMMVAQDMQRRLLPQRLPDCNGVDLEALSTPAFEVGGDYYDFVMLDEHHLGIVVGDVSGKGVSASFYMAEMKGIFQSLSKIFRSPGEFLSKAHAVLTDTIDKRSFISLIYAVLDLRSGVMTIARAGHCPLLLVSKKDAKYVKPQGLGLGMGTNEFFRHTISEEQVQLTHGDVAIFYTDGVTEAHSKEGDEFGYDRLLAVVQKSHTNTALELRDAIISEIDRHVNHEPPEDDLTIVVVKWTKE